MERKFVQVLLIEDNLGDAKFITEMIRDVREFHFRLDHAFRLSTGFEYIRKNQYDIILLDLGLPDSFGLETLERVQAVASNLPIVIMTGLDDEELGIRAVQLGAQDYLVKLQIDSNLLVRSIRYAIKRKNFSEKLRISEANLAEAQRLAHIGSYELSVTQRWARGSEEAHRILGLSPSDSMPDMDKYLDVFVHPQDKELVKCEFDEAVKNKRPYEIEYRTVLPGGEIKYVHNIGKPIVDELGEIVTIFGTIMDITERKQAEIALIESETLSRAIFEQAAVGIAVVTMDGRLIKVNGRFCRISGYSAGELREMTLFNITHPDDIEKVGEGLNSIAQNQINAFSVEKRIISKNGSVAWVNLTVSAIYNAQNRIEYFLGLVEDITERRRAEEALRESEHRLSTIFRESPSAIIILRTRDNRFLDVNYAFVRISGYSKEEIIGKSLNDIVFFKNPEDRKTILKKIKHKGAARNLEVNFISKTGRMITGLVSAITTLVSGQRCLLVVVHDITDRKKALEQIQHYLEELQNNKTLLEASAHELNDLNKKLNESNANKDKFFSILAHDLRSPFAALLGFSEYLSTNISDLTIEEIQDFSERIYKSLGNLFKLVENLLQWSRIQTGRIEYMPVRFDLRSLVDEVLDVYHVNIVQKKLRLINEVSKESFVFADRNMIDSVISNLLSNAIKFTPVNGSIQISQRKLENFQEVLIADTGLGISRENLEKLFRIEKTLSTEGTEKERGTGLGLILCREFVEINGGFIRVESTVNKGSRFSFTLPAA